MKKYLFSVIILGLFCLRDSNAQVSPKEKGLQSITIDAIKGQLEFLSSDWMEGRATGERGAYLAADYIASMFRVFGAAPAGDAAGFTYTKAYPKLEEISKAYLEQYKFNLNLTIRSEESPTGGSDFTAFTENKIPIIEWMAAMHADYHQPSDEVSLVNWNKMLDIIKLGYLQLWEAANGEIK